ncbi:unnamed protein product [Protopolystoma xenopodis]|uniref:Ethylmalonyl-CoA decarboxylase n=1 Tax=Protopolystoma xenopodis TaxID=117903 RepID=A0A3S5AB72_9PLAT|nr:unnamed protein product [Protopolystoma xenopodis]
MPLFYADQMADSVPVGTLTLLKQLQDQGMDKNFQHSYRISLLPAITVSLIEGAAFGAGAELSLCTDFRVASHDAKISFKQGDLGVITGLGGGVRLINLVGKQVSYYILFIYLFLTFGSQVPVISICFPNSHFSVYT